MIDTPKGHLVPQTVENLQEIMEKDAVIMQALAKQISDLTAKANNLQQANKSMRQRIAAYKRHIDKLNQLLEDEGVNT